MKKHNYVYTIVRQTPDENGVRRGYIGVHCTDNLEDGYFGSGRYLTRAVKKYGREDFVKTIVTDFHTEEEAVEYETELLHRMHRLSGGWKLFSERFYNLKLNESRGKVSLSDESRQKISVTKTGTIMSTETRKKMSESRTGEKNPMFGKTGEKNPMFGKTGEKHHMFGKTGEKSPRFGRTHSTETRQKISEAISGEKNPMFGKTGEQRGKAFKGFSIGISLENGKIIVFDGEKSMKARGFAQSNISSVISGKLQHYKKFTFARTKDPDVLQSLLDQNNFCDEESKIILEEFLRNS